MLNCYVIDFFVVLIPMHYYEYRNEEIVMFFSTRSSVTLGTRLLIIDTPLAVIKFIICILVALNTNILLQLVILVCILSGLGSNYLLVYLLFY